MLFRNLKTPRLVMQALCVTVFMKLNSFLLKGLIERTKDQSVAL
jgi:hypothetical protein